MRLSRQFGFDRPREGGLADALGTDHDDAVKVAFLEDGNNGGLDILPHKGRPLTTL